MGYRAWVAAYITKLGSDAVKCPECGVGDVKWRLVGDPVTRLGYVILWCSHCGKGAHLSRVKLPDGIEFIFMSDADTAMQGLPEIQFIDE